MPEWIGAIFSYLSANIAPTLFLCMGLGFLLGKVRMGGFTVGATVGTLIVGMIMSQLVRFEITGVVTTMFFA
ncbi:MAG: aspartate-alanine antiporter, partial [Clostridia bacterium]|nr:aspartate-alanine antiporter [Clostridia bacterium]